MQNFRPWRVSLIISKNLQLENGKKQTNKTSKEQKTKNKKKQKTTTTKTSCDLYLHPQAIHTKFTHKEMTCGCR